MSAAPAARDADQTAELSAADSKWLRERTVAVSGLFRQSTDNVVRIGRVLREVKDRLPHGQFMGWVADCLPFSHNTALRMMQVAEQFGEIPHGGEFDAGALYLLAQPSTPPSARQVALDFAERGHRVTLAVARNLVRMHAGAKDDEEPDDDESGEDDTPLEGVALEAPPEMDSPVDPESAAFYETVGRAVVALMSSSRQLHLSTVRDEDEEDERWAGTLYPDDDGARISHESCDDPAGLILKLAGLEPTKACADCGAVKPVFTGFSRHAGRSDGRAASCRVCERARQREIKRRRKGNG